MNLWTFLLILVLIVIIALIICWVYKSSSIETVLYKGAAELSQIGAQEDFISKRVKKIITLLKPYIKEKGSKHLENYLLNYYNYSKAQTRILKEKNVQFLQTLIEDILEEHNIKNKDEFIDKSNITYRSFLPITQKNLLCNQEKYEFSKKCLKKIADHLDIFLTKEDLILHRNKIRKLTEQFAKYNKLFKFKKDKSKWSTTKLRSMLKKDPHQVLEVDLIGLRPALKRFAKKQAHQKIDKHLLNRIRKYMTMLEIPKKYELDFERVKSLEELVQLLEREVVRSKRPQLRADLELEIERRRRLKAEEQVRKERLAKEQEKMAKEKEEERRRKAEAREAQLEHERLIKQEQERAEREREQADRELVVITEEPEKPEIELIRPSREEIADIEEIEEPQIIEKKITGLGE